MITLVDVLIAIDKKDYTTANLILLDILDNSQILQIKNEKDVDLVKLFVATLINNHSKSLNSLVDAIITYPFLNEHTRNHVKEKMILVLRSVKDFPVFDSNIDFESLMDLITQYCIKIHELAQGLE